MRKLFYLTVIFSVVLLWGCGVRGNPTPPVRKELPPARINLYQEGRSIKIKLALPDLFKDGEKIKYKSVKVYLVWKDGKRKVWQGVRPVKVISAEIWPSIVGKEIRALAEIKGYHLRKTKLKSELMTVRVTPLAPTDVKAEARDEGVYLSWSPPTKNWDGSRARPVGYIVFRNGKIRTARPVISSYYLDTKVRNGKEYTYKVAALVSLKKPYSFGEPSSETKIKYLDTFPPEPPQKIDLIVSGRNVLVSWRESETPDVVGYIVWRDGKKLNEKPIMSKNFWDRNVPPGKHSYWVTAVDDAGNNSARTEVKEVEVK